MRFVAVGARVLQVVTDDDRRGAQVFATQLGVELAALGFEVETVALAPGGVGGLGIETLGPRRRSPRTLLALRRRMADVDVTIAHGSTTGPMCALASAGRRSRRRFVYRQIGDTTFWTSSWRRRAQVRWFLGRATRVVALSERGAASLGDRLAVPSDRIVVIPNGVPAERFTPAEPATRTAVRQQFGLEPGARVVACIASLTAEKNVGLVLAAAHGVAELVVLIAGSGPLEAELRGLSDELGVDARFVGNVTDTGPLYAAADLVVSASHSEGMPGVLIEAGLAGTPVVATDVGFVADVVSDGVTGLLVPPGDLEALTAAMTRLLDDETERARLGGAAAEWCRERFAMTRVAAEWAEVVEVIEALPRLVGRRRVRP